MCIDHLFYELIHSGLDRETADFMSIRAYRSNNFEEFLGALKSYKGKLDKEIIKKLYSHYMDKSNYPTLIIEETFDCFYYGKISNNDYTLVEKLYKEILTKIDFEEAISFKSFDIFTETYIDKIMNKVVYLNIKQLNIDYKIFCEEKQYYIASRNAISKLIYEKVVLKYM